MPTLTKEQIKNNVAANFLYIRKQLKLSQRAFAELLGLTRINIGSIEEGRANTPLHVYKLSQLTNISMDTIYLTQLNDGNANL